MGGWIGLLLVAEAFLRLAALAGGPINFDVGPSTSAYISGFTESEERVPVSFRWTLKTSTIELPLSAPGTSTRSGTLVIRYARFLDSYAEVRIFAGGTQVASFSARPGRFRTQRFPVRFPKGPVRIQFLTDDPDPSRLGIAIDWIRLEGEPWTLPLSYLTPRLLIGGAFILCLVSGFGAPGAFGFGLALALAQALWFALDPFGMTHASGLIVIPGLVLTGLTVVLFRKHRNKRWLVVIFLAGYLLKGAVMFHPSYYYADVRQHRRYVFAYEQAEGTIPERGLAAQVHMQTAYPRWVAGKVYAFPYSPIFFIPFTWLPSDLQLVEDALKLVVLAAGAAEVLAVYWLAATLLGPGAGVVAALLAAFLPPMYSRLVLAMYPTIAAHLLDTLAIGAAASLALRPDKLRGLAGFAGATFGSFLTYISSLFNLTAFAGFFALLERRLAWRVIAVTGAAAALTVILLYFSFTVTFFREILPGILSAEGGARSGTEAVGFKTAFQRIIIFFGYGYPALAIAGLILLRRQRQPHAFRCLAAYGLSFLLLLALRATSGLLKDLKEILFLGPLIATASAASLAEIAGRGRSGKIAAVLITVGLLVFWLGKYSELLATHITLAGLETLD